MNILIANPSNFSKVRRAEKQIKYIVVHYTGNDGDAANDNLRYFHNNVVNASAHFFVDEKEICCSVPWYFTAWHCGTKGTYKHDTCRNSNSIGVELCSRRDENGKYYFREDTLNRAAEFIAQQMKLYNVSIDRVIRHYDVTGKACPRPFLETKAWEDFKSRVMSFYDKEVGTVVYYENLNSIPPGEMREVVRKLVERGTIKGDGNGLHLSPDMVRMFVFMNREGLFK